MKTSFLVTLAAATVLGCSSNPKPISMMGSPEDINLMVGSWIGTYASDAGDRSGTIQFELEKDVETASGRVVMYFGEIDPSRPAEQQDVRSLRLAISFIQLGSGYVSGRLTPYLDPTCECMIETLFQGKLEGDTIEGTFSSHGVNEDLHRVGTWSVNRASKSPLGNSSE
jgi:hypothetical protein